MVVMQNKIVLASTTTSTFLVESYTSIDHSIFSTLVALEGLTANVLLAIDETIVVPVMIEIYFSILTINLDEFFPIVRMSRTFIVLYKFEFVRKPPS
jgi:hypothetical protein